VPKYVKKKSLIKLAVLSLVGEEILKPLYIELHALRWNSQIIAHFLAVEGKRFSDPTALTA
jgi:hypothetical protein